MSFTQLPMSPFFLRVVSSVRYKNGRERVKFVVTELKTLPHAF